MSLDTVFAVFGMLVGCGSAAAMVAGAKARNGITEKITSELGAGWRAITKKRNVTPPATTPNVTPNETPVSGISDVTRADAALTQSPFTGNTQTTLSEFEIYHILTAIMMESKSKSKSNITEVVSHEFTEFDLYCVITECLLHGSMSTQKGVQQKIQ